MSRVLSEFVSELLGVGLGFDLGETPDPALGLGHDLVRDHDHVVAADRYALRVCRVRDQGSARSSPGTISGIPSSAVTVSDTSGP